MAPPAVARQAIDAFGLDALCEAITDRKTMTAISEEIGVSIGSLLTWIEANPERSARVKDVRRATARIWDEQAETEIRAAEDDLGLRKAKELAHHYRWRASKISPEYGDRQVLAGDPEAPLTGVSDDQLDSRLNALLAKQGGLDSDSTP